MVNRKRPEVLSTRATRAELLLVKALAAEERCSVAEVVHRILFGAVRERIGGGVPPAKESIS